MKEGFSSDFTKRQIRLILENIPPPGAALRKYSLRSILNAIAYVIRTGCQWEMIPLHFPKWRMVYHHFRSWGERGWFSRLLPFLAKLKRISDGKDSSPTTAVIDSQSCRLHLPHSQSGIDGFKRVKGIKRHLAVDSGGYPLSITATTANIHDSKAAYPLICKLLEQYSDISLIKNDMGYRGFLEKMLPSCLGVRLECVKSNFGTSMFLPMEGRWVVERTFSWIGNYRRIARNYEKYLRTAVIATEAACALFMLRYFR